ncbi:MAG: Uma2 family endonuclease [Myxacorys chilensis ATA2-1-KO14]|jgi:Uma2 family endonuclease|nr:Uma2 family endonuclease [Myxacorys chilensis ATA2-1-KO14]
MTTSLDLNEDLLYPSGDGEPMAENTVQYRWIVILKENLEIIFADDPNVFIAADMFWYPVQVKTPPAPRQAPDVMVVFGRPKGDRRSYMQWKENNIPFQVVFEVLSDSNRTREGRTALDFKFRFYQQYGVEEYYIYDPDECVLQGWQRQNNQLVSIAQMSDWTSPRLGIRFGWQPSTELEVYRPNGQRFLSPMELEQQLQQERQRAEQANQRAERAEQARLGAVPRLRSLGLTPEQIAEALDLSIDEVRSSD